MDATFENPVRFSVAPPDENLVVVHNLSAQKLRRAAKLGGMPVPSLAIIDAEKSDFTNYGEISLIADKELIDPKFRSNRVFNADIYSARAPRSRKFYSDIDYENAEKVLSRYDGGDEEDQRLNTVMKRFRSGMYDSDAELEDILMRKTYAALNWYCKEHGIKTPEDWQEQDKIKYSKDFRNWWETYAIPEMGLNPEEKMFAGTTSSGRSKWIPLSLENVVKAMTKKVRNGEGFFYGVGNIRSMKAKQFKSISQIQKQRDNIVSPETMKTLKDEIEQELKTLSSKMEQANDRSKFGWEFNTAEDCLMAMAEGGYENLKYLHDRFGDNQELFQEMADFLDKLINMPTEYFEAKLQRAVGFDEFRAAVIPDDTPADVRKILEDAGLQIYTYSDESGRKAALQLATRENNLRFSLGEYSEADQRDIVAILQPYTGMNAEREPADYQKYLAEHGVEISEQDAWEFALEAVRQNIAFARKRSEERRNQWLYENYPLYKECVDFCGSADFKIKPSIRFSGEAFSGSWISPEFVKYSEKRKRGPKENEASYRRYQERREAALARAEGTASDEIAESIARRTGRDTLEVEQELIDFFRDLKKRDFYHEYTNFREEQILGDKQAARAAFDEWIQEEEKRIQNEVVELLEQGRPITAEWIGENKKVFDELYRQLFDGKTPPGKVGKADLEAINAAIMQQGSNAATFAQAYKVAREKAYGEFMEKLRAFRDKVMAANADAISLQRDAVSFAEQNLPAESRGEFTRGILKLMEFSTAPSGKYPEGRRMHEFRRLVERMVNRAGELRKSSALQEIREMLDAVKVKRNYKGIATAVIPSEQERVDRIRRVIDMNIASLAKAVDANNEQIMKLEESGEEPALLKKYQEDNQLLEMFGDLEHRSANDVETAAEKLKNIVFGGKMAFFDLLSKRRDKINDMRSRALDDITFGKLETFVRVDPEYFTKYWLKNQSLGTLMRLASGKSIQDFDNSVFGELYREVEDSTQTEQTALRRMQRDFDEALRTICGVDGNYVSRMKRKGKFFRMIAEVNENSGVFKTEFSRGVDLESKKYPNKLLEHGRRAVLKKLIPVEDSEFHGETREGARSLLRRIDNGEAITEWDGFLLDDITIDFLRQQLADFDAGLEQSYEIFNEKQDDENFNRLLADARKEAQVMLLSHSRRESRKQVEVPLSQGAALQLLLTWEQEEFQPNMKWNGWSEESMRQIKAFLKPEVLRMGYWMRDYIARNQKKLDDAVSKRYGAHLPGIRNYFPGVFKGPNSRSVESEFGRGYGTMSINPNFLISRKFHLKPADIDADAFSTFFGNQINQAHFLAWSDTIRDLNAVYGSMRVKNAITNHFGRGVEENIRERIAVLAQGGDPSGNGYVSRLFGKMFRNWVPAKIAINQSSIIKQILGTVSYMNHVPVMEFVKYSAKANFSNPEFREFVRWAKNTDYMKNRLAGGLDRDLSYLLNYTRDSRAYSPLAEGLIDLGTWGTRWSDAWSTLHGGYAVYMYALEQARQDGKTEAEAREAARRAWMRATDETQQSGYLKDQNYFQANQGGYRYLTAFMSNPIQTMNLQIQTMYELRYGKDKKAALQKLGRQILINHLLVPSLMIATTDLIRNGFDFGDWWDELEWEDYLIGWLLGSFESLFLLGKIFGNVGNYALDRLIGRKRPFYQSIVAFPMVEDISRDIGFFSKLIDSDNPVTEKEVFSAIRALGDFLMAGGIADRFAPVGPVGALLHAIGSQGKRISGWFDEK